MAVIEMHEAQNHSHENQPQALLIPEGHLESLERTNRIAQMVGSELEVRAIEQLEDIPPTDGVYLLEGHVDTEKHEEITATEFEFEAKILSGKVDSAHTVLPGALIVNYRDNGNSSEKELDVAAKVFHKRRFDDKFNRVKKEVDISQRQAEAGELAFETVAIVIAPPLDKGKQTLKDEHDILLITKLDESIYTLDNAPWQLGFEKANLEAAEAAISALARFNVTIGMHGDAKIKNVAQRADGPTSMIDFETSSLVTYQEPIDASTVVHTDVGVFFDSLLKRGFFSQEPHKVHEVLVALGDIYLEHWQDFPVEVQDAVLEQVSENVDKYLGYSLQQAYKISDN